MREPAVRRVMDIGPLSQRRETSSKRVWSPKAAKSAAECRASALVLSCPREWRLRELSSRGRVKRVQKREESVGAEARFFRGSNVGAKESGPLKTVYGKRGLTVGVAEVSGGPQF